VAAGCPGKGALSRRRNQTQIVLIYADSRRNIVRIDADRRPQIVLIYADLRRKPSSSMPISEIEQKSSPSTPTSSIARPQVAQPPQSPEPIAAKALPADMAADSSAP